VSESHDAEQQIRDDRLAKVAQARAGDVDPYPSAFPERTPVAAVRDRFEGLEPGAESGERVRVAGRVMGRYS